MGAWVLVEGTAGFTSAPTSPESPSCVLSALPDSFDLLSSDSNRKQRSICWHTRQEGRSSRVKTDGKGKVQSFYPKYVRNEVIWAIPPTPRRISTELQPAEGIDLKLQSSWKVLQRVGSSFTEELKPVSNLSTL